MANFKITKLHVVFIFFLNTSLWISAQSYDCSSEASKNLLSYMNKFNIDFMKTTIGKEDNKDEVLFSPLSLYTRLVLVWLSASVESKNVLSPFVGLHKNDSIGSTESIWCLSEILRNLSKTTTARVNFTASVFLENGDQVEENQLQLMKDILIPQEINFTENGSLPADNLNKWLARQTNNIIKRFFHKKFCGKYGSRQILMSTAYFNATLEAPFELYQFDSEHPARKSRAKIPYFRCEEFAYHAIGLPFKGNEFFMVIMLPYPKNNVETLVRNLTAKNYQQLIHALDDPSFKKDVEYVIPLFSLEKVDDIKGDFLEMELRKLVYKNDASFLHKSYFIDPYVGEYFNKGNYVNPIVRSKRSEYNVEMIDFYVDRPFLFHIVSSKYKVTLFSGAFLLERPVGNVYRCENINTCDIAFADVLA